MTCQHCANASVIYTATCDGCVIRRLARLPPKVAERVLADDRKNTSDELADALLAQVKAERVRLGL